MTGHWLADITSLCGQIDQLDRLISATDPQKSVHGRNLKDLLRSMRERRIKEVELILRSTHTPS